MASLNYIVLHSGNAMGLLSKYQIRIAIFTNREILETVTKFRKRVLCYIGRYATCKKTHNDRKILNGIRNFVTF